MKWSFKKKKKKKKEAIISTAPFSFSTSPVENFYGDSEILFLL
jgi:hypothetical protein